MLRVIITCTNKQMQWLMGNNDVMMTSYVHPAFLNYGKYFLLIFPSIFLVELSGLTVGWAVRIRLIQ